MVGGSLTVQIFNFTGVVGGRGLTVQTFTFTGVVGGRGLTVHMFSLPMGWWWFDWQMFTFSEWGRDSGK